LDLGFRDQDLGRGEGRAFRIKELGFGVKGLGFKIESSWLRL
jgi:hypothetical protein